MSRCLKCSSCGEDISIGQRMYIIGDDDFYCDTCVAVDILDDSYFEEDDSHLIIEERMFEKNGRM